MKNRVEKMYLLKKKARKGRDGGLDITVCILYELSDNTYL